MSAEDVVFNIISFLRDKNKPTTSMEIAMHIGCSRWNIERYMKAIRQYGKMVESWRKQSNTYYYFVAENTKIYGKDVMKIALEVRRMNNEYKQVCKQNKKIKIKEIKVEQLPMKERIKRFLINLIKKI